MSSTGNDLSGSKHFQHYPESLFSASSADQHLRQQFQNHPNQLLQQQPLAIDPANSSNASPIPSCFLPENLANSFSHSTPEKSAVSHSPPSPADSGVVTDSKSDGGNMSQESLQNLDHSKLEDSLEFLGSLKSPVCSSTFSACVAAEKGNKLHFSTEIPKVKFTSDLNLAPNNDMENNVTIPSNLASIWSTPIPNNQNTPSNNPNMEDAILQALQQQQLGNWSANLAAPPPGLTSGTLLQKQLQHNAAAAQIQAMHHLAMRRSQSTIMTQANLLNRSTSYQAGVMSGLSAANKPPSYSSWSTAQGPTSRAATLFNSLHHSAGAARKLPSQLVAPPRLNRSISTPAKYAFSGMPMSGGVRLPMSGSALPTSLDENPFFKMSEGATGFMPLTDSNDAMGFSSFESQLYDIMRSNEGQALGALPRNTGKWPELGGNILFDDFAATSMLGEFPRDRFSRKVFVGGLPPDIDEDEIQASFRQFGPLVVDWPHKAECKSYFPPKGYAFLLFQDELSVQNLLGCCLRDGDKLYYRVSSPTISEKPVQIRPWNLADSDFVLDGSQPLDPRKTIFVGGVPRPLRAVELAMIMDRLYGGVCYAGIDVDPDLKYPKGAGRVAFSNQQSYIAAISARFVQLQHGDIDKRVEVKPYVLDDQHCDECQGSRCAGKFAPFFCANVTCLQYYCEHCWGVIHARPGREFHKPLVKEGADRASRAMNYRW